MGKHKKNIEKNGFSLTELMISIAIIGLVIGGSLIAFQTMQQNTATISIFTEVGQDADFILRKMERELKQAGYYYPSNVYKPILVQSDLISIQPNELTVEDGRYFADTGTLVIVGTGKLDAEKEEVPYTARNGNTFSGLIVSTSHETGSNVYDLNSLNNFVSIIPHPPTITVCFDEDQNTRMLVSYTYNSSEEMLYRLSQTNVSGDCQLTPDTTPDTYEPILDKIVDFIIDDSRIYGGRIGVTIFLRSMESVQQFQTAISLPTS